MKKAMLLKNLKKTAIVICLTSSSAHGVDIHGVGEQDGMAALYLFKNYDPTTRTVRDSLSAVGDNSLSLVADSLSDVQLVTNGGVTGLKINSASVLKTEGFPARIVNTCGTQNEITVEAWVRNLSEEPVGRTQPVRILSLARKNGTTGHQNLFYLGQRYDNAGFYQFDLQTSMARTPFRSEDQKGRLMFGSQMPAQRIVFTKDKNNVSRLWYSDATGLLNKVSSAERVDIGNIAGWATLANSNEYRLSIGNDPAFRDFPEYSGGNTPGAEWKSWLGTIYVVAIYCKALTPEELIPGIAPGSTTLPVADVNPALQITPERTKAHLIYRRLTGLNIPIDSQVITNMENAIKAPGGSLLAAARIAASESAFYNVTMRDFAARMSSRDHSINVPLNDMIATIIGIARDDISAKEMLTSNYLYRGDTRLAAVPSDELADILKSNNHYEKLQEGRYDLKAVLTRVDKNNQVFKQKVYNGGPLASASVMDNNDPAGVITSRAFMESHASAGTNRRLVERTFSEFLCIPISQWADTKGTDTYVGLDVDRAPGNDPNKFKTTCRACHSVMDSFRGAFAKVDFSAGYFKHADVMQPTSVENNATSETLMFQNPLGIAGKMNRNSDTHPGFTGEFKTQDTYWRNNANQGLNKEYFGWPEVPAGKATHDGYGIRSLASLVAESQAFPRCMAQRAYRSVCKRDIVEEEREFIGRAAQAFKDSGYKFKELFSFIASSPECVGE